MAKLSDIFSRASSLWTYWNSESKNGADSLEEGEIIFCKNNVCVHTGNDGLHLPGYFNIRIHKFLAEEGDVTETPTLILTWIPNTFIERNPKSVDQTPNSSPYRTNFNLFRRSPSVTPHEANLGSKRLSRRQSLQSLCSLNEQSQVNPQEVIDALSSVIISSERNKSSNLVLAGAGVNCFSRPPVSPTPSIRLVCPFSTSTPNTLSRSTAVKGIFSVDLRQMKSLRLFFASYEGGNVLELENSSTTGQLVIASRECQFKVFHFHFGGLDKLVTVLEQWHFLRKNINDRRSVSSARNLDGLINCYHFSVSRPPKLKYEECHPEENIYSQLDEDIFRNEIMNENGEIEDEFTLRRVVFFSGMQPSLRKEIWPFLLKRFEYNSTKEQRAVLAEKNKIRYQELTQKRLNMDEDEKELFWKNVQCTVEKDVPRTDRNHPYFAGETNENIHVLKRILLNYAMYNPGIGYTQGMSDLLAPLLIELKNESEAFGCFVGLMEKTSFVSSPKDVDMDQNLSLLRELFRIMHPKFYEHLRNVSDGLELLFAHRWILLCFKREFPEKSSLRIWESAWTRYQTDYFNLFVCLAIVNIYGQEMIDQDMKADEILFHFSTLTLHMNGDLVLRKARGLLYQFRLLTKIPCTLSKLCCPVGSSNWDSSFMPTIECVRDKQSVGIDKCQCS